MNKIIILMIEGTMDNREYGSKKLIRVLNILMPCRPAAKQRPRSKQL
jgi:hypothetical protein